MLFRPARLRPLLAAFSLAALGSAATLLSAHATPAVLTQNGNNARTGANIYETALTPAAVGGGHFGKLFTISGLNANVNGQALYVPALQIGAETHNVLYAYTSNNADNSPCGLYAFDADTGTRLWADTLPNSATYTTATPVIDASAKVIYVLSKTGSDDTGATYLHAYDVTTGAEKPGSPAQVTASAPGTGDGSVNGRVSFDGPASRGRFHANDRAGPAAAQRRRLHLLRPQLRQLPLPRLDPRLPLRRHTRSPRRPSSAPRPNGGDGGIWMAGKGLTADNSYIYCSVGNGTFDANTKGVTPGTDYGMCYLKLRASDLSVADWFAPFDEKTQSDQDLDLGNSGLVLIPGTYRLFGGATKFGTGFLLAASPLGHFTPGGPRQGGAAAGRHHEERRGRTEPRRLGVVFRQVRLPLGTRLPVAAVQAGSDHPQICPRW